MAYDNNEKRADSVYSQRVRAGKRRTYFFDVRETRGNDYFLTITESRKKFNEDGYDRHKIFLYKEDFNKFLKGITEAIDFVKTELMPDFDFDIFNHDQDDNVKEDSGAADSADHNAPMDEAPAAEAPAKEDTPPSSDSSSESTDTSHQDEHVDKW
ncbi:MAG: DUF3276 family protein [Chitinophagaceae bacterium]|nr:DUF3276 family protein [Chitinophagaceae bacterium]